jgi:hypothetical protein
MNGKVSGMTQKNQTISELVNNGNKFGFNSSAFDNFNEILNKNYSTLDSKTMKR